MRIRFPPFQPHPLLRGGHLQTLAGAWWPLPRNAFSSRTKLHWIDLPDGDRLALHDDMPGEWRAGDGAAVLIHGLGGCHASGYMVRIAAKLQSRGLRTFRLDLRGCGAGQGHARLPYHAGRWEDIDAVVRFVADLCRGSEIRLAGFSLGGNLLLNWLGRSGRFPNVARGIAVNPPIDLAACTQCIGRAARGLYDRHFTRLLYRHILGSSQWDAHSPLALAGRSPRRLIEFDDLFTAPLSGFDDAAHYYRVASAAGCIAAIEIPTLILSSLDDPMIPAELFAAAKMSPAVQLHLSESGGHLGYLAAAGRDPDRHWLDWRVVEWLCG
jgi:predicted alpha/beta-fold hydrolase